MNKKICGSHNVRKQKYIKGRDKYVTLEIWLKFDSLDKIKIIFSESKNNLGRSVKGLITSMGLKAKSRPKKLKKSRYSIVNFSTKDLSEIIREFENLPYNSYERRRPKHEPTYSYFCLARQLVKCMMRDDDLNLHFYPVRTKITATKKNLISHVCSTDKRKLKDFLINETLSQIFSTDEEE